jgi:hypothetical protein
MVFPTVVQHDTGDHDVNNDESTLYQKAFM